MSAPVPPYSPPPQRSTTRIVATITVVLLVVLAGAGLVTWAAVNATTHHDSGGTPDATPPQPSTSAPAPAYPAKLARFYQQKLSWHTCGTNQDCTRLTVPLDYARPGARTIKLAVLRNRASDRAHRVGQLVVNPGGPGGSGVDYAASGGFTFGSQVARYFDIVGFDPRGVGKSDPLTCAGTAQTDEFEATDPDPDTPAEVQRLDRLTRAFGEGCLHQDPELARNISTVEVARDLDILRAALGERQLDYLGASYGTSIGAQYAELFPTHIRRMVLDGAVDPALSTEQLALGNARGFQTALDAYLRYCVAQGGCPVGDSVEAGRQHIRSLLQGLDQHPMTTSSGRELTEGLATLGIAYPLYSKELWPVLTISLQEAVQQGTGTRLLALSDQYTHRGPTSYTDNLMAALNAVNCLDHDDGIPSSQVPSRFAEFDKASPTFGRYFAYSLSVCTDWPIHTGHHGAPVHAPGAPPIVVIGTTRDPATPYAWARSLASELDSGRLITRNGDGHTGFQQGNDCVNSAVENYLIGGTLPRKGLTC